MRWTRIGKTLNINNPQGWIKVYIYENININELLNKSVALINNEQKYFEEITNIKKIKNKIFIIFNNNKSNNIDLINKDIYIDQDNTKNTNIIKPNLQDYQCFYKNQNFGFVKEINTYKSNEVLTIINACEEKVLLPKVDDFIENIDHNKKIIYFKRIK